MCRRASSCSKNPSDKTTNKNYVNGRAREYRLMRKLEAEGYVCFRQAGSHTKIDIIALRRLPKTFDDGDLEWRFIQSKATGYLAPAEREEKKALEDRLGISIEVI